MASYPMWHGISLIKLQRNERQPLVSRIEYKYAIVRDMDGQTNQWEDFNGNRVIDIMGDMQAQIEDSFEDKNHDRVEFFQFK